MFVHCNGGKCSNNCHWYHTYDKKGNNMFYFDWLYMNKGANFSSSSSSKVIANEEDPSIYNGVLNYSLKLWSS